MKSNDFINCPDRAEVSCFVVTLALIRNGNGEKGKEDRTAAARSRRRGGAARSRRRGGAARVSGR
ncbi:hypothetical protein JCGZ_06343 [Jatropha curcas]|uniref:Uncharacterized protein n=1 Tax=Jatropha curcas TaxID=180498 RepID=A0A067KN77_JATCU|nr:hypothetical protein JCGZ_06343 [Jatropha curcas]